MHVLDPAVIVIPEKLALLELWMHIGCVEQAGDRGVDRLIGSGCGTSQGLGNRDDL
jgi:hypothetical protein